MTTIYIKQLIPTVDAGTNYDAGDCIGTSMNLAISGRLKLQSANLVDISNQGPALRILFFSAAPTGGTYTDNAPLVLSAADKAALIGNIEVAAGDWDTVASTKVLDLSNLNKILATGANYVLFVAEGTWNAAAATDLVVTLGIEVQ